MIARILLHALIIGLLLGVLARTLTLPGFMFLLTPFTSTGLITGSIAAAAGLHRHRGLALGTLCLAVILAWPIGTPAGVLAALLPVASGLLLGVLVRAVAHDTITREGDV